MPHSLSDAFTGAEARVPTERPHRDRIAIHVGDTCRFGSGVRSNESAEADDPAIFASTKTKRAVSLHSVLVF
jgi:hypothetical protein